MTRVYREPVEVQAREDGRPSQFAWRGRRYTVHAVQDHWVANRDWWRDPDPLQDQPKIQFWRVEASAGQELPVGTYELRRDVAAESWTLRRIAD